MALQIPAPRQPVVEAVGGSTIFTRPWFLFLQGLYGSRTAPSAASVGVSPYSYVASDFGIVAVTGGTVSLIELGRNGVFVDTGFISGTVSVSPSDVVRVTYSVTPTVTFIGR